MDNIKLNLHVSASIALLFHLSCSLKTVFILELVWFNKFITIDPLMQNISNEY